MERIMSKTYRRLDNFMEKKYRTEPDLETGLLRIIALKDFSDVKKGDRGGLIEKEKNLSQEGDCWVYGNARVFGNAQVFGNARVYGEAQIYERAWVGGNACVSGFAEVSNARVYGKAKVYGDAKIFEWADVCDHAQVYGKAKIYGNTQIFGNAEVFGNALVCEAWCKDAKVSGNVKLWSTNKLSMSITSSIKNSKDYVILAIGKKFYIFSSHVENVFVKDTSIFDNNYTKNIQIIRQLYGKEI